MGERSTPLVSPREAGPAGVGLAEQIREAEDRLAFLRSRTGAATCAEMGEHDWRHLGGRNAGCGWGDGCNCSVPVYECARCKECDYGDNAEAVEVRAECDRDWAEQERRAHLAAARPARGLDDGGGL